MEGWILAVLEQYGYFGVLALILIENVFPPIPSELILTFGGFLTVSRELSAVWMITAATAGSVIGAMILYGIGMFMDIQRLERLADRHGKWLRVTRHDIRRADAWFRKYGPWTVLLCRVIPLVRSLISIPAGMAGMNFPLFVILTAIGSFVWNTVLIALGMQLGTHWKLVLQYMDTYSVIIYALLLAGLVFAGLRYIAFYRKRR
ncbi:MULTISPECIES: DedA family protein [Sporosarcina]|uniref:DedA family protein n=1 Tax=Sporosarcina TaxID=1569 RepID=UPI00058CBAB9|nr:MULTISPECIES: DedA family protein [Sporosarcina]WJY26645.1 DedA family protein [Sporosarcina sp. 0.2-SM1T-5]